MPSKKASFLNMLFLKFWVYTQIFLEDSRQKNEAAGMSPNGKNSNCQNTQSLIDTMDRVLGPPEEITHLTPVFGGGPESHWTFRGFANLTPVFGEGPNGQDFFEVLPTSYPALGKVPFFVFFSFLFLPEPSLWAMTRPRLRIPIPRVPMRC